MDRSKNNTKHVKYSLVIPCYNEQDNISELVERCRGCFKEKKFEVIFVDNGSTDKTYDNLKRKPNRLLISES